jgi:hypothetical protein
LIQPFLGLPHVEILITPMENKERHGVDYETSKWIWQQFLADHLSRRTGAKAQVIIQRLTHTAKHVTPFLEQRIDAVVYCKGLEKVDRKAEKRAFLLDRKSLMAVCNKARVPLYALIVDRPEKATLSSTQFMKAIAKLRSDRIGDDEKRMIELEDRADQVAHNYLPHHLPHHLSRQAEKGPLVPMSAARSVIFRLVGKNVAHTDN